MYKRIVLAYDGSESGQKALLDGFNIAQWSHSELFLIAIMPQLTTAVFGMEGGFYQGASEEQDPRKYLAVLEDGLQQIIGLGAAVKGEVLIGESVEEITRYARRFNRGRSQAFGWVGGALVARLEVTCADRTCALQRARHHNLRKLPAASLATGRATSEYPFRDPCVLLNDANRPLRRGRGAAACLGPRPGRCRRHPGMSPRR